MDKDALDSNLVFSSALTKLREWAFDQKVRLVMRTLYPELSAGAALPSEADKLLGEIIETIQNAVPNEQTSAIRLADQVAVDSVENVLILQLSVRKTLTDCRWLHYSLAVHLAKLSEQGYREAAFPAFLHAVASSTFSPDGTSGQGYISRLLAEFYETNAPRASIYWAGRALQKGELSAMSLVKRMGSQSMPSLLAGNVAGSKRQALQQIGRHFGWQEPEFIFQESARSGLPRKVVVSPSSFHISPPHGETSYYIFGNLETPSSRPPISVYSLEEGFISVDLTKRGSTEFYVFDKDRTCYSDLSRGVNPFIQAHIERFDGTLASLGDKFCGPMNVCHFLLDHLTRIELFNAFGTSQTTFLLWEYYDRYQEILEDAGIENKIKVQNKKKFTIQAKNLLISSNATFSFRHPAHLVAPWAVRFLRASYLTSATNPNRKIFISRTDSRSRQIKNFDEVHPILVKHGFEVITLSDKTFPTQKKIFAEAKHIVGVHGAGLTNMLFSNAGAKVMEIFPPISATQAYWLLAKGCGHSYRAFLAQDPEYTAAECAILRGQSGTHGRDILVDPVKLDEALEAMNFDDAPNNTLGGL